MIKIYVGSGRDKMLVDYTSILIIKRLNFFLWLSKYEHMPTRKALKCAWKYFRYSTIFQLNNESMLTKVNIRGAR